MTTTTFIETNTFEILDYNQVKAHEAFDEIQHSWPSSPTNGSVDVLFDIYSAPIARFYETEPPTVELYQVAEHAEAPGHYFIDAEDDDKYKRAWSVRNMTQPELDDLNAQRQEANSAQRSAHYQMLSDPLCFKYLRGDTTSEEWLAKVNEIKAMFPYPEIITIPE